MSGVLSTKDRSKKYSIHANLEIDLEFFFLSIHASLKIGSGLKFFFLFILCLSVDL